MIIDLVKYLLLSLLFDVFQCIKAPYVYMYMAAHRLEETLKTVLLPVSARTLLEKRL